MDLIDRQSAIDALMERFKRIPTNAIIAKNIIENLPSAQPEQRWILCSEKLPEEGVKVLACLKDWQTGESKTVVSYRIDNNYWHGYGRYNEKCVAWMPLPEPYVGKRTKETDYDYERAVEQLEHDMLYEPTFNQDDGSM